jgi:hypothetical protein
MATLAGSANRSWQPPSTRSKRMSVSGARQRRRFGEVGARLKLPRRPSRRGTPNCLQIARANGKPISRCRGTEVDRSASQQL